jgi:hypothetical protein
MPIIINVISQGDYMDESEKLDCLIYHAKWMLDGSREKLLSAIDRDDISEISLAQNKHDQNVKRLSELMDRKFPETVGIW